MPLKTRQASKTRRTRETDISVDLSLDGGPVELDMELGFFKHMLEALALYAGWGLKIKARGDLEVDAHHLVEDVGLTLGEALAQALGDYDRHARFGSSLTAMDDALVEAAADAGRRPYLHFQADWPQPRCGDFELSLIEEFWRALVGRAGFTLHIIGRHGRDGHHLAEAVFKGTGRALAQALAPKPEGAPSAKGRLI